MQVLVLEQLLQELVQRLPLHVLRVAGQRRQQALQQGRQVVRLELQPQLIVWRGDIGLGSSLGKKVED